MNLTKTQTKVLNSLQNTGVVECKPATLRQLKNKGILNSFKVSNVKVLGDFTITYYSAQIA